VEAQSLAQDRHQ